MRLPDTDQRSVPGNADQSTAGTCPDCGWPDSAAHEVLSEHRTSDGRVTWVRCQCGALQVRVDPTGPSETVARGRPTGD